MQKPFKTTLSNGLRVILLENHAAPVVSWNLWANVGSVNETDEEAGICHLIEHMIFKGTGRRPVGQIAKEVEAAGGDMNAYTSFDETVFYINMSSRKMDVGLDILADAALDPTYDQEELTREMEVVVEEISRSEDNPSQMVSQDLFSTLFHVHPYRRPIAGSRETVRGVSRRHLLDFYRRWYVGSNLVFIGVGHFNIPELLPKVETLFSKIPAGTPPKQQIPSEPTQRELRVITRSMPVEGRYVDLGVPIPDLKHPDIPALDLFSHILGGGGSSRLEQAVKEKKQLVSSIASYAYTPRHPGLLIIGSVLKDKALKETFHAVWEEVEKMKQEPPSALEMARARDNIRSTRVYERQTVEALARKLGYFEGLAGDLAWEEEYYANITKATPEDVQRAAQTYLLPDRVSAALCHPKSESWPQDRLREWFSLSTAVKRAAKPAKKTEVSKIHKFRLSSGVRVLVRENRVLPLVSVRSASLGGLRSETLKNSGISHLVSLLLTKGTVSRTGREIAEETEGLSGHVDGYMGRNLLGLGGTFLSEKIAEGMELFFDLLLNPTFPEGEILKEKGHTYTALRNEDDSLSHLAMKKFLAGLYPKHPYGLSALGTHATVKSFRRKDLIRHYAESVRPGNLVISIVGDVSAPEIRERLEEKFGNWKGARGRKVVPPVPKAPSAPVEIATSKKKLQAHIVYGFMGTTLKHPDRFALDVLSSILSGQGGRLFLELRDKQGLAYAVSCSTQEGLEPGFIAVYMGTDAAKLPTSVEGIKFELEKIRGDLVTEEELDRAKRFIIGNYELELQRNSSVASLMAYNEIYGLSQDELFRFPERIEAVTREDVMRVAKKYLRREASVLSVTKP